MLTCLRKQPPNWQQGKKALDKHFGAGRSAKEGVEKNRYDLLSVALEHASKKDARRLNAVLERHSEAAVHAASAAASAQRAAVAELKQQRKLGAAQRRLAAEATSELQRSEEVSMLQKAERQ